VSGVGWLGVLAFVLGILGSVMIHEWGHMVSAKHFGAKVTEFFVGFGTKIWSFRRGETEYGLKAIPAGGYVKIIGMTDLEPIAPEDEERAFYRKPAWQRAVTLCAGSFMHLVLGLVLYFLAFGVFGTPTQSTAPQLSEISSCVPATATGTCKSTDAVSPAKAAGLQPGDTIVSVDGKPVSQWTDATAAIRAKPGQPVQLVVERAGRQVDVVVTPVAVQRPDPNDASKTVTQGFIGVAGPTAVTMVRSNPVSAVGQAFSSTWQVVSGGAKAIVGLPAKMVQVTQVVFGSAERDPNGPVGVVGISRISGEIAQSDLTVSGKISTVLQLLAGFNIFIGLFNMLPLLPLDGGHVAVLGYERLRAAIARRRGQPEPDRPDMNKLLPLVYVVFVAFVAMTVLLVAADILKPIQL
jgi:membrane-associated protease RseP (regulator of RpoE activity)